MKKAVLLLAFLSCATGSGFSQDYDVDVNFNNHGLLAGDPPSIQVHNFDGSPLVGTNWVAQLYYGAWDSPESSLIPVNYPPAHFRLPTTIIPGTWAGGSRTLVGFSDTEPVVLQVKVWDGGLFPNYETAFGARGFTGKSVLFGYTIPGAGSSPNLFLMLSFQGFTLHNPSAPLLSVVLSRSGNQFVLSWPTNAAGFTLQTSPNLAADATWTDFTNAPASAGEEYFVTNTVSSTNQFYRLKKGEAETLTIGH